MDPLETDNQTLSGRQVRTRLVEHGVKVGDLARAASMPPSDLSAILHGRPVYLGPERKARIERAIGELGLDRAAPAEPTPAPDGPIFRIRRP
jgi:hypothetical protein